MKNNIIFIIILFFVPISFVLGKENKVLIEDGFMELISSDTTYVMDKGYGGRQFGKRILNEKEGAWLYLSSDWKLDSICIYSHNIETKIVKLGENDLLCSAKNLELSSFNSKFDWQSIDGFELLNINESAFSQSIIISDLVLCKFDLTDSLSICLGFYLGGQLIELYQIKSYLLDGTFYGLSHGNTKYFETIINFNQGWITGDVLLRISKYNYKTFNIIKGKVKNFRPFKRQVSSSFIIINGDYLYLQSAMFCVLREYLSYKSKDKPLLFEYPLSGFYGATKHKVMPNLEIITCW
jgi:hypothetical protein